MIAYISLNSFFYRMKVADIANAYCDCGRLRRTVDHLLLHCSDSRELGEQTLWADGQAGR